MERGSFAKALNGSVANTVDAGISVRLAESGATSMRMRE